MGWSRQRGKESKTEEGSRTEKERGALREVTMEGMMHVIKEQLSASFINVTYTIGLAVYLVVCAKVVNE